MKRNKIIAGIVLVGLLSLPSAAVEFKSGFSAGVNMSQLIGSDAKTLDDSTKALSNVGLDPVIASYPQYSGFTGSVRFCAEFNNWVALLSELSFAKQGNIWKGTAKIAKIISGVNDTVTSDITIERRLSYLSVPLFIAFKPHFGAWSPMLYGGPSFAFNFFAENSKNVVGGKSGLTDIKYLTYAKTDPADTTKHDLVLFNGQACFGAGVSYTFHGYDIVLDARYSRGGTSIIKGKAIDMSSIAVTLGLLVPR